MKTDAPRLIANKLAIRIHFLTKGQSPRAWAHEHRLNYPTVHKVISGGLGTARKRGVARRIIRLLNRELTEGLRRSA